MRTDGWPHHEICAFSPTFSRLFTGGGGSASVSRRWDVHSKVLGWAGGGRRAEGVSEISSRQARLGTAREAGFFRRRPATHVSEKRDGELVVVYRLDRYYFAPDGKLK